MGSYRKDITDEEISREMQPVLKELEKFLVPRVKPENETTETENSEKEKNDENMNLTDEEKDYMKSIIEHPSLSVTARGEKLFGFSADKRTRLKNNLINKKLIVEFSVDLGPEFGGRVKMLRLTEKGYKAIDEKPLTQTEYSNRPSLEHICWQELIARDYTEKGYKAVIEKKLKGKSADIGVIKDNEIVAVEVELTPKNAITNLKQNIDAGFTRTIIACRNRKVKKETEKKLNAFLEENPQYKDRAEVILLTDFPFVKKIHKIIRG